MPKSLVEQQFGPSARAYAECEVHRSGASLSRLVEVVAPQSDWRVLDVATGAGHTAAIFAPLVAHVVASDITQEMLTETRTLADERLLSNVSTTTAEAHALAFEPESFDLVTCRLAAHHFADIEQFLAAACRVLKKGGLIAVVDNITPDARTVPGLSESEEIVEAQSYNDFERLRDPSHARALSATEWRASLERQGFELRAEEMMEKEMAFQPWVERMHCSQETVNRLRDILAAPSRLSAFLKPRDVDGQPQLTLRESIFVAVRT
ncbi:MAG: class I SAM-dependent methyltransferase [Alphaproteobacteria bacterium]|nr:class I SAM-dependent methyltransferase [Alphaproteobacteria bacterium]